MFAPVKCQITQHRSQRSRSPIFALFLMSTSSTLLLSFFGCKLPAFRHGGVQLSSNCHLERQDGMYILKLRFSHLGSLQFICLTVRLWLGANELCPLRQLNTRPQNDHQIDEMLLIQDYMLTLCTRELKDWHFLKTFLAR